MTRTTDDLQPTERWRPLGDKVTPPAPPPPKPKEIAPGVIVGDDGRFRTNLPLPKG